MRRVLLSLFLLCHLPIATAKERLVVAGGSLTEIVYALGAQEQLVGVDSSSVYPQEVSTLPSIGYYRTLNVEGVLSLQPTKILLLDGAGPVSVIQQLSKLDIKTVTIQSPKTISGLIETIREVALQTENEAQGNKLIQDLTAKLAKLSTLPQLNNRSAVFLMSAGERGLVAAGKNTTPQLIFEQLNITNPFSDLEGFKAVSEEALAQYNPDIVLLASHTSNGQHTESLCELTQLKLWASANGCHLVKIDSLKYLGLTPRLPEAIRETRELLETL